MLRCPHAQGGVTLIELVVGMGIVAILLARGAPTFLSWIQNAQVRTAAAAIQDGLQLARGEAVRRNALVRFQFTSSMDNSCALSTAAGNWVVSLDDPTGACASAPSADAANAAAPRVIQNSAIAGGTANAVVAAGQATIVFNGLGRVSPVPAGDIAIDISNPAGGACVAAGGQTRCLRVVVSATGQTRLCDPALTDSGDPQFC